METWGWIVVYVVGFTLLQLLLFRYFKSGSGLDGARPDAGERAAWTSGERGGHRENRDGDGVYCEHCGAYNEGASSFSYCQQCVSEL